jgi:hypothetical protein
MYTCLKYTHIVDVRKIESFKTYVASRARGNPDVSLQTDPFLIYQQTNQTKQTKDNNKYSKCPYIKKKRDLCMLFLLYL